MVLRTLCEVPPNRAQGLRVPNGSSDGSPEVDFGDSRLATPSDRDLAAKSDRISLTFRENEIFGCVAAGLQNKQIARTLDISVATVKNHVHNLLGKIGVHSKLEAVSLAFRSGWIMEEEAQTRDQGTPGDR